MSELKQYFLEAKYLLEQAGDGVILDLLDAANNVNGQTTGTHTMSQVPGISCFEIRKNGIQKTFFGEFLVKTDLF